MPLACRASAVRGWEAALRMEGMSFLLRPRTTGIHQVRLGSYWLVLGVRLSYCSQTCKLIKGRVQFNNHVNQTCRDPCNSHLRTVPLSFFTGFYVDLAAVELSGPWSKSDKAVAHASKRDFLCPTGVPYPNPEPWESPGRIQQLYTIGALGSSIGGSSPV